MNLHTIMWFLLVIFAFVLIISRLICLGISNIYPIATKREAWEDVVGIIFKLFLCFGFLVNFNDPRTDS